ncbi:MAG: hypothetical protein ACM37U_06325 [Gemmatimonas sp.]
MPSTRPVQYCRYCPGVERDKRLRFRHASGTVLERWTGFAIVHAGGTRTADDVVFGEPGDMVLLGARSLEGLNLRIDPVLKQLVDAGPAPRQFTASRVRHMAGLP